MRKEVAKRRGTFGLANPHYLEKLIAKYLKAERKGRILSPSEREQQTCDAKDQPSGIQSASLMQQKDYSLWS